MVRTLLPLMCAALALGALGSVLPAESRTEQAAGVADGGGQSGVRVRGWRARFDDSEAAVDLLFFRRMRAGLHLTNQRAALVWRDGQTATGPFTFGARFSAQASPTNIGAFGLFIGGYRLDSPNPHYISFLARNDGQYLIEIRNPDRRVVVDWTPAPALMTPDGQTALYNHLIIEVTTDTTRLRANGTELANLPTTGWRVDGLVGIRTGDSVDFHIEDFELRKLRR